MRRTGVYNKTAQLFFTGLMGLSATGYSFAAEAQKPNIVFILTDDQGYGDMGRTGNPILKTPNIDRLYDQSVRFDNFCVAAACAPTRTALMTGLHHFKSGVTHTIPPREHMAKERTILPQFLKQAGYMTAHFGKWHMGDGPGYSPKDRGFDYDVSIADAQGEKGFFNPVARRNGKSVPSQGFREDVLFDEAIRFIGENKEKPFFCYLATWSPHDPLRAPEEDIAPYRGKVDEKTAVFYGMVANVDKNVGRLMARIEELGLSSNTIVMLMNDNGGTYGVETYNAGMRGCKCTSWVGGFRAFSLWSWPGKWQPHNVDVLTDAVDVLPTLTEIAGVSLPPELNASKDGFSLVPLLEGRSVAWEDRMVFQHVGRWAGGMAALSKYTEAGVRWKNFMLARREPSSDPQGLSAAEKQASNNNLLRIQRGEISAPYTKTNAQFHWGLTQGWELYDVVADPACQTNLSAQMPELTQRMEKAYDTWWDGMFPQMMEQGGDEKLKY
ncbi:MAG: arylsulfatase [Kiritimatiellaceae bacterium]|nr:arylsulfatase [Kiritimatiellaceae bacterium]